MAGWGLLSGIISLHHSEKGDNGDLSLSERISDAIHSRMDEKARWVPRSQGSEKTLQRKSRSV